MKLLMLYGVNCTKDIWRFLDPYLNGYDVDYVIYPHDVTLNAKCVDDITKWVYNHYQHTYDAIIGHSLGGIIALQLVANYNMDTDKVIYLDTNLKPANDFYKNLMLPENMDKYRDFILEMFNNEKAFYHPELLQSIQTDFDYTDLVKKTSQDIYAIYGDRGQPMYQDKLNDLNLSKQTLNHLHIRFIKDSCHMMMVENPKELSEVIKHILKDVN